ncbi:MAG: ATP-binding protein [Candidatus Symbiothrix sp.]|jgi:predicted AAA+ superfamily ATPase|nr:ATP-binding protein [Candidatus Symbiothrix sp.]
MSKKYIKRHIDSYLYEWKQSVSRKPLLLRGARQIGKSSSVRELAKQFDYFIEVNFEKDDEEFHVKEVFKKGLSPKRIGEELSVIYHTPIVEGRTLLFFDEIQACIPAISSLRFFYEDMPELHLIAAGSLLEFALEELPSFGVGRIRSLFMYPLSFDEYLRAMGFEAMADAIKKSSPEQPLSEVLHHRCLHHLVRFITIGGMPEVVATYSQGGSLLDCQAILDDLMLAFYDDFAKYKARVSTSRLREVFLSVTEQTGNKFIYSRASQTTKHEQIKEAIELLSLAGLVHPVIHTAANGIPLGAEVNPKIRKYLIFDTGILQRFLRLDISQILLGETLEQINKGAIAELFAGLEILKAAPCNYPSQLYYWQREQRGSQAEVDYVIQQGAHIVPVEVKAGTRGAMQSLSIFMSEKKTPFGIRCSLENFGLLPNIRIYPLYAVSQLV